ncbi:MAG: 5-oxoprolinase subunit PxpB [Pseudomonadota bacterium]
MAEAYPVCKPQGDAALILHLGQGIDPDLNARLRALAQALRQGPLPGQVEVLAAYACLMVQFDPLTTDHAEVEALLRERLAALPATAAGPGREVTVPVVYGGEHGPDLAFVAERANMTPAEVIARHTGRGHLCHLVGFTPGFPFLGGLDPALACPRLDTPRSDLMPGATGIGGDQTGLYPLGGPGGWRILGRTPLMVYDPDRDPVTLIQAGDLVRFFAVDTTDFAAPPTADLVWSEAGRPALQVLLPGGLTTIQDQGRRGRLEIGVPISGALDQAGLAMANALVGNPPDAAALELTLLGPRLKVLAPVWVAVAGADLGFRVDGRPAPAFTALALAPGQVIDFSGPQTGARAVLAMAGGLANRPRLGSRSTYALGRLGRPLMRGDVLCTLPGPAPATTVAAALPEALRPRPAEILTLRAVPGPNLEYFSQAGLETFFGSTYQVSQRADRRGVRLTGPAVELKPGMPSSILSEPNTPGIVQVPPDGAPIVLLKEQTVGGYAKAATVIGPDLDRLARAMPGQALRLVAIEPAQAVAAARAHARRQQERLSALRP